jgi:hypothetical protein
MSVLRIRGLALAMFVCLLGLGTVNQGMAANGDDQKPARQIMYRARIGLRLLPSPFASARRSRG